MGTFLPTKFFAESSKTALIGPNLVWEEVAKSSRFSSWYKTLNERILKDNNNLATIYFEQNITSMHTLVIFFFEKYILIEDDLKAGLVNEDGKKSECTQRER